MTEIEQEIENSKNVCGCGKNSSCVGNHQYTTNGFLAKCHCRWCPESHYNRLIKNRYEESLLMSGQKIEEVTIQEPKMNTVEKIVEEKPAKVLTATQKNYVVKRVKEISEEKISKIRKEAPRSTYDWRGEISDIPSFEHEAELKAIKQGKYTINRAPDFTGVASTEAYLSKIVIVDEKAKEAIRLEMVANRTKERDVYFNRLNAVKKEANSITDNLLLSDAKDILESLKKFEGTEY